MHPLRTPSGLQAQCLPLQPCLPRGSSPCSCIPVIIQDQVEVELSSLLDVSAFSLRVAQADMGRLPEILMAVPQDRIQEMQVALWRVWHR